MIKILRSCIIFLCYIFITVTAQAEEISSAGLKFLDIINSLKVEEKWLKGAIVNCKTGEIAKEETEKFSSKKLKRLTYSGCFIYAVTSAYGVPESDLPPHPKDQDLISGLSKKQADWYQGEGKKHSWKNITNKEAFENYIQAQKLANEGYLVIASYKNLSSKGVGHSAVVVPSNKLLEKITKEGPDIAQAGTRNFSCVSLKQGFKGKKNAFKENNIKFYYYSKLI